VQPEISRKSTKNLSSQISARK